MKTKDLPIFKQKILEMLPVLQVDMWKKLDIDSREGSYIVNIMLKENLLTRRRKDSSFLLEKLNGDGSGNIADFNEETEDDIKKKKADADLKKKTKVDADLKKKTKADADLRKKTEKVLKKKKTAATDLKKNADVDLIQKAEEDLKKDAEEDLKKRVDVDLMQKVDVDLMQKVDVDLMQKAEEDLKKRVDVDLMQKAEEDLKNKVDADLRKKTEAEIKKEVDFTTTTFDKNIQNIKTKDVNTLKQEVLDILPILQADVWKKLDACDCNYLELIDIMVKENLITRTKRGKFFLLEAVIGDRRKYETKTDIPAISSAKQVQKKKPKDTDDLKKLILRMLPIAPSDLLEKLDVSNSVCSNAINTMVKENIITRTEKNGHFLLEKIGNTVKKHETNHIAMLSSKKRFAPCCGCTLECDAVVCMLLTDWLLE